VADNEDDDLEQVEECSGDTTMDMRCGRRMRFLRVGYLG
jgi:hypothetical protein